MEREAFLPPLCQIRLITYTTSFSKTINTNGIKPSFNFKLLIKLNLFLKILKAAAADVGYFARSKFSRSLVHKKNFSLMGQIVFKLGYVLCQER